MTEKITAYKKHAEDALKLADLRKMANDKLETEKSGIFTMSHKTYLSVD